MVVETLLDEAKICSFFIALGFKFRITVGPHDRALGKFAKYRPQQICVCVCWACGIPLENQNMSVRGKHPGHLRWTRGVTPASQRGWNF